VCNIPLGGEVVEKQDSIEELGEIFDADSGQFFKNFAGNNFVARAFFCLFEMVDDSLDISTGETGDWLVKLIWGPYPCFMWNSNLNPITKTYVSWNINNNVRSNLNLLNTNGK
jgi:hypothetical protein